MKAMVLAAGFGARLRPLTTLKPKPMFPILGQPVLEHTLYHLKHHGIHDITINLHHLPSAIENYFGNGSEFDLDLHFSHENAILGTAGGILAARRFLDGGPFIVINSDIITDIDLEKVVAFHQAQNAAVTMVLFDGNATGIHDPIELDENGRVVHMVGASSMNTPEISTPVTFTGVQVIEPEIFDRIPDNQFCGTTKDIYPQMIEEGLPIYGYLHEGYWQDMGTLSQYLKAHQDALDERVTLFAPVRKSAPATGNCVSPVWLGDGCQIAPDATVGPYAVLGEGCAVESGAVVKHSVCWAGSSIAANAKVDGCVLTDGVRVPDNACEENQAIIPTR